MSPVKWSDLMRAEDVKPFQGFLLELVRGEKKYLLRNDILLALGERRGADQPNDDEAGPFSWKTFLKKVQEIIVFERFLVIIHRHHIMRDRFYKAPFTRARIGKPEEISVSELLDLRDFFVLQTNGAGGVPLKIDFTPFYDYAPHIRDPKNVGKGIEFLNRHLSSSIFQDPRKWHKTLFEFLKIHSLGGKQLLINGVRIPDDEKLIEQLDRAVEWLSEADDSWEASRVESELRALGFEPGWGGNVARILETLQLLLNLFEAPDSGSLEAFISRIPMVSNVAVISPHGFFGQEDVLGKPDTGGQVVYILDQVTSMEAYLTDSLRLSGLNVEPKIVVVTRLIPKSEGTASHVRLEKIRDTRNCWILRVPFRGGDEQVVDYWISRFWVWPYLEKFAYEAKEELTRELGRNPDLIIGNYSDGNLVASILSEETGVIQCNIAHALEKSKYLFSDLYWQNMEPEYHFSLQFTADLLAMNMADFIIASTFQEIAGTPHVRGQYESYLYYSLPGFYQVLGGVNLFHPKFNVISPGVDESVYFPHTEQARRDRKGVQRLNRLLFEAQDEEILGTLEDAKRIPIFTMARLDKVKNVAGLVESFGKCPEIRNRCNLIVVAGRVDAAQSEDPEEKEQIERIHHLIEKYDLDGQIRWIGKHLRKADTGEIYRIMADMKGVFVQPALFEAFGLTVLEAMSCGLPVFATQFGGPSEIIQHGVNGFLINPTRYDRIRDQLVAFLETAGDGPLTWNFISQNAIARVREKYTWQHYNEQLMKLTKLYGFWRYAVTNKEKRKMKLYSQTLFHLLFKQRAAQTLGPK